MLFLNNLKAIDCGLHMRHFGKETTVLMSRTACFNFIKSQKP